MRKLKLCVINLLLIAFSATAQDQQPSIVIPQNTDTVYLASPTPANSIQKETDDHFTIRRDLAQTNFDINPSLENRVELLSSLEELVRNRCLRMLPRTLQYTGSPGEGECLTAVNRTLSLDPKNPTALCARDGIDSLSCSNAFLFEDTETIESYKFTQMKFQQVDLDYKLFQERIKNKASELQNKLVVAKNAYQFNKSPENENALKEILTDSLNLNCGFSRTVPVVTPTPTPTPTVQATAPSSMILPENTPKPTPTKRGLEFLKISDMVNDVKMSQTPAKQEATRIRYISSACSNLVDIAKNIFGRYDLSPCYLHGPYSPGCIQARRTQPQKPGQSPRPKDVEGLSTF